MILFENAEKTATPFPHFAINGVFDADEYRTLLDQQPSAEVWDTLSGEFQGGRRRLKGDAYKAFLAGSPAWSRFDAYVHSPAFVQSFLNVYADDIATRAPAIMDGDWQLCDGPVPKPDGSWRSKVGAVLGRISGNAELYVDLDFSRGETGYWNEAHADRNFRVAVILIYLCDQKEENLTGGELVLYEKRPGITDAQVDSRINRFPDPSLIQPFKEFPLRHNTGVSFLAVENSFHGVNRITSTSGFRKFLYIAISSKTPLFWE